MLLALLCFAVLLLLVVVVVGEGSRRGWSCVSLRSFLLLFLALFWRVDLCLWCVIANKLYFVNFWNIDIH